MIITSRPQFLCYPGEIGNRIYDFIICGLPRLFSVNILPDVAFVNILIHREFMTRILLKSHFNITSMADIRYMHMLVNMHSRGFPLHNITTLTVTDFTVIAHTQTRPSEVMDFLSQFESLDMLSSNITLDDLFHGLQGRVKALEHLITEFELSQILVLGNLSSLDVVVKRQGVQVTH
ncbi:hypothetical protein E8E11_001701 [Didymella keratinophila]|nr:hypothetical protein E8E11_001701 [Didymella keratinophila]